MDHSECCATTKLQMQLNKHFCLCNYAHQMSALSALGSATGVDKKTLETLTISVTDGYLCSS